MATISEIRRSNLLRLRRRAETEFNQNEKNAGVRYTDILFCKDVNLAPSAFSQLKNKKQKPYFNEIYVRSIEKHLNIRLGWFDQDRDSKDIDSLRINFQQFRSGLMAYHDFMDAGTVTINDDKK